MLLIEACSIRLAVMIIAPLAPAKLVAQSPRYPGALLAARTASIWPRGFSPDTKAGKRASFGRILLERPICAEFIRTIIQGNPCGGYVLPIEEKRI